VNDDGRASAQVVAQVAWVRPGVNGYGVGRVVSAGTWQGDVVAEGDTVAIPPGVTTSQAPASSGDGALKWLPLAGVGLVLAWLFVFRKRRGR
jgi:LPXTG-motif cell wall-anchored protein